MNRHLRAVLIAVASLTVVGLTYAPAAADVYTVRWAWEVPDVTVGSPVEFTVQVGDITISDEDLNSHDLVGLVGVITVTVEVTVGTTPPSFQQASCPSGDGAVLTIDDVDAASYFEASFRRADTLEVIAGPHQSGMGSEGSPLRVLLCPPLPADEDQDHDDGEDDPGNGHDNAHGHGHGHGHDNAHDHGHGHDNAHDN